MEDLQCIDESFRAQSVVFDRCVLPVDIGKDMRLILSGLEVVLADDIALEAPWSLSLELGCSGYWPRHGKSLITPITEDVERIVLQLVGVLLSSGFIVSDRPWWMLHYARTPANDESAKPVARISSSGQRGEEAWSQLPLSEPVRAFCRQLGLDPQILGSDGDGNVSAIGDRLSWNLAHLEGIMTKSGLAERVRVAAEWLSQSFLATSDGHRLVAAVTGLEALYGDPKEKQGIGKRLIDRCSYSIAKTMTERNNIAREISEVYDARSRLLHRGAFSGDRASEEYVHAARRHLQAAIRHEAELAKKDP